MSFFGSLGQMFGLSKPKREGYQGETPQLFHETQAGKDTIAQLQARLRGEGLGFAPEVLTRAGNAATKSRLAGLTERELPAIQTGASARGLGRSTVVGSQQESARQGAERDIESRLAQMQLANEQQRKMELQNAINSMQQIGMGEAGQSATKAGFQMGNWQQQEAQRRADEAAQMAGVQRSLTGVSGLVGGALGLLPGMTPGFNLAQLGQGAIAGIGGDLNMYKQPPTYNFAGGGGIPLPAQVNRADGGGQNGGISPDEQAIVDEIVKKMLAGM